MSVEYVVLLAFLVLTLITGAVAYGAGLPPLFNTAGSVVTTSNGAPPGGSPPVGTPSTPPSDDADDFGGGPGKVVPACERPNPPHFCP